MAQKKRPQKPAADASLEDLVVWALEQLGGPATARQIVVHIRQHANPSSPYTRKNRVDDKALTRKVTAVLSKGPYRQAGLSQSVNNKGDGSARAIIWSQNPSLPCPPLSQGLDLG
ncbi:MAG TPA: hypothetical protein DDX54_02890 [Rhodospirillaceae bacterium]|nr:hypothetical protein [Rhodospirillaceae bacterium]